MKIFMFPFVGANRYSYNSLASHLNFEIVVYELPGRGLRMKEPLLNSFEAILDDAEVFFKKESGDSEDFYFFGHSLGGIIAYYLCQRLAYKNEKLPKHLFLSSCLPDYDHKGKKMSELKSEDFWESMLRMGGVTEDSKESEEFRSFWEPIFKADYACLETLEGDIPEKLNVPASILSGKEEKISRFAWENHFLMLPNHKEFNGGHFYLFQEFSELASFLNNHGGGQLGKGKSRFWQKLTARSKNRS